jgi:hypothetical protein
MICCYYQLLWKGNHYNLAYMQTDNFLSLHNDWLYF